MANNNYLNKIKVLDSSGKVSPGEGFVFALGTLRVDDKWNIIYDNKSGNSVTLFEKDKDGNYQLTETSWNNIKTYIDNNEKFLKSFEYDQESKEFVFTWNYDREDDKDNEPSITRIPLADLSITADTVYFTDDLTTTYEMGNYELTNGSAIIPAKGKSLKEVWDMLYIKEDNKISISNPSISLTVSDSDQTVEVGSTFTRPTATLKITGIGSYEYGSKDKDGKSYATPKDTGVIFNSLKVGFGSNIDSTTGYDSEEGSFTTDKTLTYTAVTKDINNTYVKEGTTTYTFCAEAHHKASNRYPVTNLGNYIVEGSISGGILTGTKLSDKASNDAGETIAKGAIAASKEDGIEKTAVWKITGYREGFYFGTSEKVLSFTEEEGKVLINSDIIRNLANKTQENYKAGTHTITVPANTATVIMACPASNTGVTNIHNNTVNANMNESFKLTKPG